MKKILLISFAALTLFIIFPTPQASGAVDIFGDVCSKSNAKDSSVCKSKTNNQNPLFGPDGILTTAINLVSLGVAIVSVVMIILGGLKFITSGENPQEVTKARETIIYALAGLVIALVSQAIVHFVLKSID